MVDFAPVTGCVAVGSTMGAVPALLRVRFPWPPFEPDVRLSPYLALHGICRWGGSDSLSPGSGDRVAPIAVSPNGHRGGVKQGDPVRADGVPPPGGVGEPAADVGPIPAMPNALPVHQPQHPLVFDPVTHPVHQVRVVDAVKARLDISVEHPAILLGAEQVNLSDRVVRASRGPKPVGDRLEVGLKDGF
ncbi:hypothetical protein L766_00400 [Mycobacterium tuberculosis TRS9]|nr:hypothetical protein M943_00410 [Mycobacterium tuberculosis EAI5]AQN80927.1 hypothetical protein L766_00400 [Mycobacterium tuberculosis TRS9]AQP13850.1 hypothetical protein L759_00410 [Mycobacterium tuberculosis TRS2]KEG29006.1 hypothetical protein EH33_00645 [Mycobacterium tuberculosis]KEG32844.1 hypothetical protein EN20_00635 [Mycobacterium tuberculosis]